MDASLFDDIIRLYQMLLENMLDSVKSYVFDDVKARSRPYRTEKYVCDKTSGFCLGVLKPAWFAVSAVSLARSSQCLPYKIFGVAEADCLQAGALWMMDLWCGKATCSTETVSAFNLNVVTWHHYFYIFEYSLCPFWLRGITSMLWHCWVGGRKGIQPVKNWVVGCWRCYVSDFHMAQLMPLPLIISCSSKSRLVLLFWCQLTRVILDKIQEGRKTVVFVCISQSAHLIHLLRQPF